VLPSLISDQRRLKSLRFFLFFVLIVGFAGSEAEAQRRLPQRPIPYTELEQEEGVARLREMRQLGITGVYSLLAEVRVMPRRGKESRFQGQVWGTRNEIGPIYRYEFWDRENAEKGTLRFLVQNGEDRSIWVFDTADSEAGLREIPIEELFTPIEGMEFTPFDLQLPFIYWEHFSYEGLSRVRGRSSHGFLMKPPQALAEAFPWLEGVRMFLDAEFNAMTGAEIVGEKGKVLRAFNIIDIKRVDDQWLLKTVDYRNETSGDKTRLSIGAAALGLEEHRFRFTPEMLEEPFPAISRDEFVIF